MATARGVLRAIPFGFSDVGFVVLGEGPTSIKLGLGVHEACSFLRLVWILKQFGTKPLPLPPSLPPFHLNLVAPLPADFMPGTWGLSQSLDQRYEFPFTQTEKMIKNMDAVVFFLERIAGIKP